MYIARTSTRVPLSKQTVLQVSRVVSSYGGYGRTSQPRAFSTTRRAGLREYFPQPETAMIRKTKPAWEHPEYVSQTPFPISKC
jgi:hypothetical protein